jgi:hypothetical protein
MVSMRSSLLAAAALLMPVGLAGCALTTSSRAVPTSTPLPSSTAPPAVTATTKNIKPVPPNAFLAISPSNVAAGQRVTVSAHGCSPGNVVHVTVSDSVLYQVPIERQDSDGYGPAQTAGANGSVTFTARTPMGTTGTAVIHATCNSTKAGDNYTDFAYPAFPITITSEATLSVSPDTSIHPGTTLTVDSSVGANCVMGYPEAFLDDGSGNVVASNTGTSWPLTLVVPANSSPGSYSLAGSCMYEEYHYASGYFPDVSITVT